MPMIRRATVADIQGIVSVAKLLRLKNIPRFYWHTKTAIIEAVMNDLAFVYVLDGRIVAFLWLRLGDGKEAYLEAMAVSRRAQDSGIGRIMVKHTERLANKAGKTRLLVFSFYRYGVAGFYKKMGFRAMRKPGYWFGGYRYHRFYKDIQEGP